MPRYPQERHVFPWALGLSNRYRHHGSGTYCGASFVPILAHMLIAPLLGLAQAAVEVTIERLNRGKRISYTGYLDSRQAVVTQMQN